MPDYSPAARARVALSYEACQLAETARRAVPIAPTELHADGTPAWALDIATDLLEATARYLEAVVVFTRLTGAHLDLPEGPTTTDWWRTHLLQDPLEAAQDLDDWLHHHTDEPLPPNPVSGPLA
ncbi:hypothetical protein EV643_117115 [Kribbella sp. VKM Ac-2527]|uniref:Uncharacterized protein n=2 Tax=Kribbella caucasensis TaxID=2512215 RepID=A0A4R6K6B9_9ACTN|nr:hypothetical protein EV643_117115 [Kribbella sp. VKM Ac-2527]